MVKTIVSGEGKWDQGGGSAILDERRDQNGDQAPSTPRPSLATIGRSRTFIIEKETSEKRSQPLENRASPLASLHPLPGDDGPTPTPRSRRSATGASHASLTETPFAISPHAIDPVASVEHSIPVPAPRKQKPPSPVQEAPSEPGTTTSSTTVTVATEQGTPSAASHHSRGRRRLLRRQEADESSPSDAESPGGPRGRHGKVVLVTEAEVHAPPSTAPSLAPRPRALPGRAGSRRGSAVLDRFDVDEIKAESVVVESGGVRRPSLSETGLRDTIEEETLEGLVAEGLPHPHDPKPTPLEICAEANDAGGHEQDVKRENGEPLHEVPSVVPPQPVIDAHENSEEETRETTKTRSTDGSERHLDGRSGVQQGYGEIRSYFVKHEKTDAELRKDQPRTNSKDSVDNNLSREKDALKFISRGKSETLTTQDAVDSDLDRDELSVKASSFLQPIDRLESTAVDEKAKSDCGIENQVSLLQEYVPPGVKEDQTGQSDKLEEDNNHEENSKSALAYKEGKIEYVSQSVTEGEETKSSSSETPDEEHEDEEAAPLPEVAGLMFENETASFEKEAVNVDQSQTQLPAPFEPAQGDDAERESSAIPPQTAPGTRRAQVASDAHDSASTVDATGTGVFREVKDAGSVETSTEADTAKRKRMLHDIDDETRERLQLRITRILEESPHCFTSSERLQQRLEECTAKLSVFYSTPSTEVSRIHQQSHAQLQRVLHLREEVATLMAGKDFNESCKPPVHHGVALAEVLFHTALSKQQLR